MMKLLVVFGMVCVANVLMLMGASAQTMERDSVLWLPVPENNLPTKVLELDIETVYDYHLNSISSIPEIGEGRGEIVSNRRFQAGLKFPIWNETNFRLNGGLSYLDEEFEFESEDQNNYPLYASLQDRNLKVFGLTLYYMQHLRANRSLNFRTSIELSGDFYDSFGAASLWEYGKVTIAAVYGIRKDKNTSWGFGAYYGYTFGSPSIYPVFVYSSQWGEGWGVDLILPSSLKLWHEWRADQIFYLNTRVKGHSYTIDLENSVLEDIDRAQFRYAELRLEMGYQRKLYGWLWAEAQVGLRENLSFNLSESNFKDERDLIFPQADNDYLIESNVRSAPFFRFSLFLAPSAAFLKNRK